MMQTPKSLIVAELSRTWKRTRYDLFLAAIGYEERSRYIAEAIDVTAESKHAIGFYEQREQAYEDNLHWFGSNGYETHIVDDASFRSKVSEAMDSAATQRGDGTLTVLVDISSLSRFRLATIIDLLQGGLPQISLTVHFVYSLAEYNPPSNANAQNSHVGPMLRSNFAGWWVEPDRGITAIVGLGYEPDKALGAVEHLQAADIWTFTPRSKISEYSRALEIANESLLSTVERAHQLKYNVHEPFSLFVTLESLVYGVMQRQNPVLLPFGPKLFALCCLLVACVHRDIAVWRVSAQEQEPAINRKASGYVYGLVTIFSPNDMLVTPATVHPESLQSGTVAS